MHTGRSPQPVTVSVAVSVPAVRGFPAREKRHVSLDPPSPSPTWSNWSPLLHYVLRPRKSRLNLLVAVLIFGLFAIILSAATIYVSLTALSE